MFLRTAIGLALVLVSTHASWAFERELDGDAVNAFTVFVRCNADGTHGDLINEQFTVDTSNTQAIFFYEKSSGLSIRVSDGQAITLYNAKQGTSILIGHAPVPTDYCDGHASQIVHFSYAPETALAVSGTLTAKKHLFRGCIGTIDITLTANENGLTTFTGHEHHQVKLEKAVCNQKELGKSTPPRPNPAPAPAPVPVPVPSTGTTNPSNATTDAEIAAATALLPGETPWQAFSTFDETTTITKPDDGTQVRYERRNVTAFTNMRIASKLIRIAGDERTERLTVANLRDLDPAQIFVAETVDNFFPGTSGLFLVSKNDADVMESYDLINREHHHVRSMPVSIDTPEEAQRKLEILRDMISASEGSQDATLRR